MPPLLKIVPKIKKQPAQKQLANRPPAKRQRADLLLLALGLVPSRAKAKSLIENGDVTADGVIIAKVSQMLAVHCQLVIASDLLDWVSRGALKLLAALDSVPNVPVKGAICADVGASTGGFTEVLLKKGAARVYAVDVGHDQLAPTLRGHPKIINLEGLNARALTKADMPEPPDIIVCDVSFISLKKALPPVLSLAATSSWLITLIKPQFEAGRAAIGKGGIIRDESVHEAVCRDIQSWAEAEMGYQVKAIIPSPIAGSDGNVEFLMIAHR